MLKGAIRILAAAIVFLTLGDAGKTAEPSGKLTVALSSLGFEATLPQEGSWANHVYWSPMYDFMFEIDKDGKIAPGLVTEWKLSDDLLTWTFTIRKGVKWHNGRELDAEDVAFNFGYWVTAKTSVNGTSDRLRDAVESAKATGPNTVVIKLTRPYPAFLYYMSWQMSSPIVPKEYGTMDPKDAREHPIGTGPYKFVSRKVGDYIRFEAVKDHWRRTAAYKELELRVVPEASSRIAMIKRGEADVIDIPVSQGTEIRGLPMKTIRVPNSLSAHLFFTGMYDDKAAKGYDPDLPWRKVGVREALNIAINRPAILNRIFNKEGTPAPVAFPMPGLGYDNSWKLYDYDPARAKKLLADNGYPNGFDITLYSLPRPGLPDFPLLVEAVADDWSKLGLRVKIVNTQWGTIRGQQRNKALTGGVVALTFGPVNPDGMRGNIAAPFYYFAISPELNAAEEAIKTAKTDKELIDASLKLGTIERDVSAFVPLYFFNSLYVVDPKKVASWDVRAHFGAPDAFGTITKP